MGDSKEKKLLPFLYMIDDVEKWNDINELRKSNPNLGVSIPVDFMLEEIAIAEGSLSKKAEFMTKYCCVKQNSSLAWLEAQTVEKASGAALKLVDFQNSYCVGGIDLSQTRDLTACTIVIERDGELYVFAKSSFLRRGLTKQYSVTAFHTTFSLNVASFSRLVIISLITMIAITGSCSWWNSIRSIRCKSVMTDIQRNTWCRI